MKRIIYSTVIIFAAVWILFFFLKGFENKIYDWKARSSVETVDTPIILIKIDQESVDFYNDNFGLTWPWPRSLYAKAIDYLHGGGAKAVGIDIIFSEPSFIGAEEDEIFAASVKKAGNVFFPLHFKNSTGGQKAIGHLAVPFPAGETTNFKLPAKTNVQAPIKELLNACRGAGYVDQAPDKDAIYRRLTHFVNYKGKIYPSLPLVVALFLNEKPVEHYIPDSSDGAVLVKYYHEDSFRTFSIADLIQSGLQVAEGKKPILPPEMFKDKIVFIGATAPGLLDLRPTPVDPRTPGFVINATALVNFLKDDYPGPVPPWIQWLLVLAVIFTLNFLLLRVDSYLKQIFISILTSAVLISFNLYLFKQDIVMNFLPQFIAVTFVSAYVVYYRYQTVGKEKKFLKHAFRNYLSESLLNDIVKDPKKLRLGGEKKCITIFFSDLAGFTTMSEALEPEEVVNILNLYLERMTQFVLKNNGFLNKFEGDAIMAFWGAPVSIPEHASPAVKTALDCQKELELLNEEFIQKGLPALGMRIGVNTGDVIVGNIGSIKRFEYTVIGDAVNLASRLEGINKQYGTGVICGSLTRELADNDFLFRRLDMIRVKGKLKPTEIFEVVCEKETASDELVQTITRFEDALGIYFKGDFKEALQQFESIPGDGPSQIFAKRCKHLLESPPADWDGIISYKEK
ncbi:MAG: adenylate/guanylate cyclase domain-containing protein [bacterium]|nr:adenylate/guanylate cyclase domain-containing protein [bacterium]